MPILETGKVLVEKLTGWARPSKQDLERAVRDRKPHLFRFKDDGVIPNHPTWPLLIYKSPVRSLPDIDPAALLEDLFASNKWENSWRNGVYPFVHYHSRIHEVLGVASGEAEIQFGGNLGRSLIVRAGDVAILPAGTGHKRLTASADFLVVGAYPPEGTYDLCKTSEDHDRALDTIPHVARPGRDPVYGAHGPLLKIWR
ncbi:MAG: cupin domain-containing protein [Hyphomicrobiales bacterium]